MFVAVSAPLPVVAMWTVVAASVVAADSCAGSSVLRRTDCSAPVAMVELGLLVLGFVQAVRTLI